MSINKDLNEIMEYAHCWNWLPDWFEVKEIYSAFPYSYSVLCPFAYTYLEEIIRSMTSEYGKEILDESGNSKRRKVGMGVVKLAIEENNANLELVNLLEQMKPYFTSSSGTDAGNNRNSVAHGYMHSGFWKKEAFESLIHDIAILSKYSHF